MVPHLMPRKMNDFAKHYSF